MMERVEYALRMSANLTAVGLHMMRPLFGARRKIEHYVTAS